MYDKNHFITGKIREEKQELYFPLCYLHSFTALSYVALLFVDEMPELSLTVGESRTETDQSDKSYTVRLIKCCFMYTSIFIVL